MRDSRDRKIEYLRISVTDRCNLRCEYCMPEEGVPWISHGSVLTYEEIVRLCRIMAPLGISRVRLTGGEPLVRRGADKLAKSIKEIPGIETLAVTTNGTLLEGMAEKLRSAGVDALNISLDTLDPDLYRKITRCGNLDDALRGIDAALKAGFNPVKINCVMMPGVNDAGLPDVAALAKNRPLEVRFIEQMPVGQAENRSFLSAESALETFEAAFGPAVPYTKPLGSGPARYYSFDGFSGRVGFITAMSHEFCGECNRIRLTSDGYLKLCLFFDAGINLLKLLREGRSDAEISREIIEAVRQKPARHEFCAKAGGRDMADGRGMNSIGG